MSKNILKTYHTHFKNISKIFGSLVVAVCVFINIFAFIFNYTGVHITNQDKFTDYKWESHQFFSKMNEGYAWFRFDKYGFNNAYRYKNNTPLNKRCIDVLLMGSSHMEAAQMFPQKNAGYLLNVFMPKLYTYNIGVSNHNIYRCFKNLPWVCKTFKSAKYIVIETSSIKLDNESMSVVVDDKLPTIASYDEGLMYIVLKTVPGIKLVCQKIVEWGKGDSSKNIVLEETAINSEYKQTLKLFIQRGAKIVQTNGAQLIIVYHPDSKIDKRGRLVNTTNKVYLDIFRSVCKENKIIFIDLTKAAETLYSSEHRLTHGFINTAVGVGHLNEYGHELFAHAVANKLRKIDR